MLTGALKRLMRGASLDADEACDAFAHALDPSADASVVAALLVAWRMKGETAEEIAGAARAARACNEPLPLAGAVLDVCGTGGDARGTFNISTAAAIVAAVAGVRVLKLVSPLVSSRAGCRETLMAIGLNCDAPLSKVARCLESHGLAFVSRAVLNPRLDALLSASQRLGVRVLPDLIVPLASPANVRLLGVHDARYLEPMARALWLLGERRGWVVCSAAGLDELSTCGASTFLPVGESEASATVRAADVGLTPTELEAIKGGTPKENAGMLREILAGDRSGPLAEIVALNAGAALVAAGAAHELRGAVQSANEILRTGAGWGLLQRVLREAA